MYKSLINTIHNSSSSSLTTTAVDLNKSLTGPESLANDVQLAKRQACQSNENGLLTNDRASSIEKISELVEPNGIHDKILGLLLNATLTSTNSALNNLIMPKLSSLIDLSNDILTQSLSKQKELDLIECTKRTNDQKHRQKLQDLLVKCLDDSISANPSNMELSEKISCINTCLSNMDHAGQSKKRKLSPASTIGRGSRSEQLFLNNIMSNYNCGDANDFMQRNQNNMPDTFATKTTGTNKLDRLEKARSFFKMYTQNLNGDSDNHSENTHGDELYAEDICNEHSNRTANRMENISQTIDEGDNFENQNASENGRHIEGKQKLFI